MLAMVGAGRTPLERDWGKLVAERFTDRPLPHAANWRDDNCRAKLAGRSPETDDAAMLTDAIILFAAGVLAGGMNAIAGGGSFISFPAMVFVGLPSVVANASSTVALVPGTLTSAGTYMTGTNPMGFRDLGGVRFPILLASSVAGGLLGALLLLATPVAIFDGVIPWLLLVATITFAFGRDFGAWLRARIRLGPVALLPVQFILGIYGGYFGGAVGIMMLAAWSLLDGADLKQLNPTRTIIVSAMNGIAVVCFILAGQVWWPQTVALLAGGVAGGYLGARAGQALPALAVRRIIIAVTVAMTLIFFKRAYL